MPEQDRTRPKLAKFFNYFRITRSPSAIFELDGLRGIAILLVLFRHGVRPFYAPDAAGLAVGGWDMMIPMINGWMGVDLFFVLSGFLVTYHILRRWGNEFRWSKLRDYLLKRILRIVPAYYVFMFVVVAGAIPYYDVPHEGLREQVLVHLCFLQDYVPSRIVTAFWSLGVEEKFYLSIPLLVIPLVRMTNVRARLRVILLLISFPIWFRWMTYLNRPEIATYEQCFWVLRSPFHLAVDSLLVGTLCAFLHHDREQFRWLVSPRCCQALFWGGTAVVAYLLGAAPLLDRIDWFSGVLLFPVLGLGFGAMLLALVSHPGSYAAPFRSPTLFFFSKISYSLYLVHMVFISSTYLLMCQVPGFKQLNRGSQFLCYFPVFCLISIAAALVLHYAVEKPFLILKDNLPTFHVGGSRASRRGARPLATR